MIGTSDKDLAGALIIGCRALDNEGVLDSSGHLSYRVPGTDNFVIPSRRAPGLARRDSLLTIDGVGKVIAGRGSPPLEWPMHASIYRCRPDVGSVLHSHSPMSRAFSVSRRPIQLIFGVAIPWLNQEVPIYSLSGLISNLKRADYMVECLGDGSALLLRAHGNVIVGPTIEAAVVRAHVFETTASSLCAAYSMGEVDFLTADEVDAWRADTPSGCEKAWEYLVSRANGAGGVGEAGSV